MAPRSPLPLTHPVAAKSRGGHTPEKEGPTPDAATHWLSLSERGWLNSREWRGYATIPLSDSRQETSAMFRPHGANNLGPRDASPIRWNPVVASHDGDGD